MSKNNLPKGRQGENQAQQYLRNKGYRILDRHFCKRGGEIDLIALHNNTLIFIEVKTRFSDKYGLPEESVTPWKIRTLIRTAQYYKLLHPELPDAMRIDVVAIEMDERENVTEIRHIENITS